MSLVLRIIRKIFRCSDRGFYEEPVVNEQPRNTVLSTDHRNIQDVCLLNNEQQIMNQTEPVKYFEADGVQFKLANSVLYKKEWVNVDPESVRIINTTTNKVITNSKYCIQYLEWIPVDQVK